MNSEKRHEEYTKTTTTIQYKDTDKKKKSKTIW